MIKIQVLQTNRGAVSSREAPVSTFQVTKTVDESLKNIRKFHLSYGDVLKPTLNEIKALLLDDWLNEGNAPDSRTTRGKTVKHYITGDLWRSVKYEVASVSANEVKINFGYFKDYGKNLEEGGPLVFVTGKSNQDISKINSANESSRAYPIIKPMFEKNKGEIKRETFKIVKDIFERSWK